MNDKEFYELENRYRTECDRRAKLRRLNEEKNEIDELITHLTTNPKGLVFQPSHIHVEISAIRKDISISKETALHCLLLTSKEICDKIINLKDKSE